MKETPMRLLPALLLLAALLQLICCHNVKKFAPDEALNEDDPSELKEQHTSQQHHETQQNLSQSQMSTMTRGSTGGSTDGGTHNLNDTIRSIFHFGPEEGLQLFNRPKHVLPVVQKQSGGFVFPDQLLTPDEPRCDEDVSQGRPFCTKVSNYPALKHLDAVLTNVYSNVGFLFNEDLVQPQNITQRMNHEPHEEYFCLSTEKIIYPEAGVTKDSTWLWILNNHDNYKQGVRIEECLNEGKPCKFMDILPNHYRATCKQHYIYRSLVALTPNGTITKDYFKTPSCCKCVLSQDTEGFF